MDGIGPFGTTEVGDCELQKKIAQWCRIENRGVEEPSEIAQVLVSHLEILSFDSKLIEHLAALNINVVFELQNVFEADTPVRTHQAERQFLRQGAEPGRAAIHLENRQPAAW